MYYVLNNMKRFDLSFHFLCLWCYTKREMKVSVNVWELYLLIQNIWHNTKVICLCYNYPTTHIDIRHTLSSTKSQCMHMHFFTPCFSLSQYIYMFLAVLDRWIFVSLTCLIHLVFSVCVTESFRIELSLELLRQLSRFQLIYYFYLSILYILDDKSSILKPPN